MNDECFVYNGLNSQEYKLEVPKRIKAKVPNRIKVKIKKVKKTCDTCDTYNNDYISFECQGYPCCYCDEDNCGEKYGMWQPNSKVARRK